MRAPVLLRTGVAEPSVDPIRTENFPVALGVLPAPLRRDLTAVYRFARHVDDVGDEGTDDPSARSRRLDQVTGDLQKLYAGDRCDDPAVAGLADVVRRRRIPADPFLRLVRANQVDQQVTRYETFEELRGYCRLSADPVGEIVLHVFGRATPDRVQLSDRVCTALQLLEHWQDVREDYRNGRIYLPLVDLRRFGVAEEDLDRAPASPQLRALLAFQTDRAMAWLGSGAFLVSTLTGWARLAVSAYVAGGRAAARALRDSGYDPITRVPKPTRSMMARSWLEGRLRWPG